MSSSCVIAVGCMVVGEKGMIEQPLPEWLSKWTKRVSELGLFGEGNLQANHVYVWYYLHIIMV